MNKSIANKSIASLTAPALAMLAATTVMAQGAAASPEEGLRFKKTTTAAILTITVTPAQNDQSAKADYVFTGVKFKLVRTLAKFSCQRPGGNSRVAGAAQILWICKEDRQVPPMSRLPPYTLTIETKDGKTQAFLRGGASRTPVVFDEAEG